MEQTQDERRLRWLARLVTVLTAVMIVGVVVIVALLVTRLGRSPKVPIPEEIDLPGEAQAISITIGPEWYLVVTDAGRLLMFDRGTGAYLGDIEVPDQGNR